MDDWRTRVRGRMHIRGQLLFLMTRITCIRTAALRLTCRLPSSKQHTCKQTTQTPHTNNTNTTHNTTHTHTHTHAHADEPQLFGTLPFQPSASPQVQEGLQAVRHRLHGEHDAEACGYIYLSISPSLSLSLYLSLSIYIYIYREREIHTYI